MQVDFKDRKLVFPPVICSTELRPDGVIWSVLTRTVILLELTCCAEEGIEAAQMRKEARYADLMSLVSESKWTPTLLTLEVGARGLVCSKTFHAFTKLGFSSPSARSLCKSLSEIVARCSYAIYLGHSSPAWPHNNDLVRGKNSEAEKKSEPLTVMKPDPADPVVANIVQLKRNGIIKLYHFTDSSNVKSIKEHGLMSASNLLKQEISSTMNSSEGSRQMDASAGLENYVRLSFCSHNPMLYVALEEKRITNPVILEISLQVVSRPGVLFSDCNATRTGCIVSTSPKIVRFDLVTKSYFLVDETLKHFYQAEVLVPSPIPPHLITIPAPMKVRRKATIPVLPEAVPVPLEPVKRVVLPESVKVECPVRTDEKVSDELSELEPDRVEVARNGSVANDPLVVAVSSTSAAPAIPYTRRSPCEGESKGQLVGCLSDLVAPVSLAPAIKIERSETSVPVLMSLEPAPVFEPALIPLMPVIPAEEKSYVKHGLKPDGSCVCGDTGCDGPPVLAMVQSSSVCSSSQFLPTSKVSPPCSFVTKTVTSASCRLPNESKMPKKRTMSKLRVDEAKRKEKKNNSSNIIIYNAADVAAKRKGKTLGAAC
jgi:hypothetical protein